MAVIKSIKNEELVELYIELNEGGQTEFTEHYIAVDCIESSKDLIDLKGATIIQINNIVEVESTNNDLPKGVESFTIDEAAVLTPKTKKEPKAKKSFIKKNFQCDICNKEFKTNQTLTHHIRIHNDERPEVCNKCNKSFRTPAILKYHMRTHTGERPYNCKLCPKGFKTKAAINRHHRVHTGEKPYACPQCDTRFTQSNSMKLHVKTVHLKQPAPYQKKSIRLKALNATSQLILDQIKTDSEESG